MQRVRHLYILMFLKFVPPIYRAIPLLRIKGSFGAALSTTATGAFTNTNTGAGSDGYGTSRYNNMLKTLSASRSWSGYTDGLDEIRVANLACHTFIAY